MEVTFDDVARAHERIKGVTHRTPVLTSRTLDRIEEISLMNLKLR